MRFLFFYETDEQYNELKNIIMSESLKHFKDKAHLDKNEFKRFQDACYDTISHQFMCDKCMEKALGRPIQISDLRLCPLSEDWAKEHYDPL